MLYLRRVAVRSKTKIALKDDFDYITLFALCKDYSYNILIK